MSAAANPDSTECKRAMPPGPLVGPAAWRGEDMAACDDWLITLDADDLAELDAALASVNARNLAPLAIDAAAFPLPRLAPKLIAIRDDIVNGRGFALVRGLPVTRLTRRDAAIMYWGLGAHLGTPVSQNGQGHLLGHVLDVGRAEDDPNARIYQTNARQFYHADSCDIVGLLCINKARSGGASTIVSSETIYNELRAREPDLVDELFQPFHVDRRGEVPPGARPWYRVPVFNWFADRLTTYYVRRYIYSARRFHDVPPLTSRQEAAFDALDAICDESAIHLSMEFEPGDMQFLHNHQILHDRTAYVDHVDPDRRRHLLRLWLCPPNGRPLPPAYAQRWGSIEIGQRGGIRVEGVPLQVPLEP